MPGKRSRPAATHQIRIGTRWPDWLGAIRRIRIHPKYPFHPPISLRRRIPFLIDCLLLFE
jgi:hypothetical protein